jgi:hypothetical protein
MSFRFQADADLNPEIQRGLRRREPAIDFRVAPGVISDGTLDADVLRIAADAGRVLVSHDVRTMPGHFEKFVSENPSPGLLLIPSSRPIGMVTEGLLLVWLNWPEKALRNQIRWLPHPD